MAYQVVVKIDKVLKKNAPGYKAVCYTFMGVGGGSVAQSCLTLATLWTVACQPPLSMGFSRQVYWSGLQFPSPRDLPNSGIEPGSPPLQVDSLPTEPPGKRTLIIMKIYIHIDNRVTSNEWIWSWSRFISWESTSVRSASMSAGNTPNQVHPPQAWKQLSWGWMESWLVVHRLY